MSEYCFAQRDSSIIIERNVLTFENLNVLETNEIEIISASRTAKKVEDLPVSVYVVTREEIQLNGYITLADVLKSIPGFIVSQPGSGTEGETFLMRGFQGNFYTKIMINNIPITPSVTGSLAIGSQLPVRQAERIEIIFGPASAVYGADATSGVINIITKDPESFNFAQADLVGGTGGYSYLNFSVGGKAGKNKSIFQYTLYGSRQDFDNMNIIHENTDVYNPLHYLNVMESSDMQGFLSYMGITYANEMNSENLAAVGLTENLAVDTLYPPNYSGTLYKPDFTRISQHSELLGVRLKFKNLTFGYNYMFRQDHSSLGLAPYLYRYDDANNYIGNYSHSFSAQHSIPFGDFVSSTNISYLNYRLDNYSSYGINYLYGMDLNDVYIYQASDDINFEQILAYTPNEKIEIVGGFSYQHSGNLPTTNFLFKPFDETLYQPFSTQVDYADTLFGTFGIHPRVFSNTGMFIQGYLTRKKLTLIGGIRHDINSDYGKSTNPRWALLYKMGKKLTLRLSTGNSFKAPSEDKEYYSIATPCGENIDSISYAFIPNDLKPEKFKSHEFGIKYKLGENTFLDICIYNSIITNLIKTVPVSLDSVNLPLMSNYNGMETIRRYENVEKSKTIVYGTQFSLTFNDLLPAINLDLELHYTSYIGEEQDISPDYFTQLNEGLNPDYEDFITDTTTIRMLPKNFGQINMSFIPFKNIYVNIEGVWQSSWLKSFIPATALSTDPYFETKGFFNLNILLNYKIGRNFYTYVKVSNLLNSEYGGLDATRTDIDLPYNPQLKRNIRIGINYRLE